MSEPSVVKARIRRRAVRSAGPPPDDAQEIEEIVERDAAAEATEPVATAKTAVVDVTVKLAESEPVITDPPAPADTLSNAADVEPIPNGSSAVDAVDTGVTVKLAGSEPVTYSPVPADTLSDAADVEPTLNMSSAVDAVDAGVTVKLAKSEPVTDAPALADTLSDAADAEPVPNVSSAVDTVDAGPKAGAPGWLLVGGMAAAALLVIAMVVMSGFFMYGLNSADNRDARRADYVQTAKQAILNLTTIKDDTAQADIDRVLAVSSGELRAEYSQRRDAYASVVEQAKVKATGEIIESAIESEDANTARVLVAAKQTLTNAGMAEPQTRFYRFRVTLTHGDNGTTASQVEFVA